MGQQEAGEEVQLLVVVHQYLLGRMWSGQYAEEEGDEGEVRSYTGEMGSKTAKSEGGARKEISACV